MPTTVPNKPTNGAVEPMVARAERPRFISAWTMATERSSPRLAASMTSESETCCDADWNSDRKSTRLNSSHGYISYAVFCLKKKKQSQTDCCATTFKPHAAVALLSQRRL